MMSVKLFRSAWVWVAPVLLVLLASVDAQTVEDREDKARQSLALVMESDDEAHIEIDAWIREREAQPEGSSVELATFRARIRSRLEPVEKAYRRHLERWEEDARGWNAFASFLNDQSRREEALLCWGRALELTPEDASIWNNLANARAEMGEPAAGFRYLEKARELRPKEPTYSQNLATMILAFEEQAREFYREEETSIPVKAKRLYEEALKSSPQDFHLVAAWANVFYRLETPRAPEAIQAWERAFALAPGELEKQGVLVHLARWRLASGDWDQASELIQGIQDPFFDTERREIAEKLEKLRD